MSTQTINLGDGRSIVFTPVTPQRIAGRPLSDPTIPFGAQVYYSSGGIFYRTDLGYTKVGMPDGTVGYMSGGRCYKDSVDHTKWYLASDVNLANGRANFVNGTGGQVQRQTLQPGDVFVNPKGATMLRRRASDKSPINTLLATTGIADSDCDPTDLVTVLGNLVFVKP